MSKDKQSLGSSLGLEPHRDIPQPRAWHMCRSSRCRSGPQSSRNPKETPSGSCESQQLGHCTALQRQPWNFSQALATPKNAVSSRNAQTRGGGGCRPRSPQPQLLPFPSTSPPSSQRLPAALMLPISCPEAPVLPPVFLTALAAPGALCGRVKGKQAAEAAPGWADSPQLPKAAVPPPPPNALLTFSPLGFQPRFSSPSRVGMGKRRAQGGGTHSSHRAHVVPLQCHQWVNTTSAIPRASLPSSAVMTSPPSDFLLFPLGSSTDTHRCTKGSHSTAKSSGKGKALSSPCEIMAQKWPEHLCVRHWVRYQ